MESLAVVPLVIGLIHGSKFLHRNMRQSRSKHRISKWEKRIANAMALIDSHKDFVKPPEWERFVREHAALMQYKQNYLAKELDESAGFLESWRSGKDYSDRARDFVRLAYSTSTEAAISDATCRANHSHCKRNSAGKCSKCFPESTTDDDDDDSKFQKMSNHCGEDKHSSDTLNCKNSEISIHQPTNFINEPNPWQSYASLRRNLDAAVRLHEL